MVSAQVVLTPYADRVINVVKAQQGFKDKSQALNYFIETHGDDVVEREASEEYVKRVLLIADRHGKKHGNRRMTLKQLDELCGD
ncbi:hypothetical protein COX85_01085 [Candidatus Micrarchaeota archaeon CG_4_10_14_0_2_um_filter_55_9]|nr:MAG: hypothetical protein AUJ15_01565 [Candidatus Micrarchaeota archaeon CG1_02_55_41]PIZ91946.1 MAG: hypothetical protein COX85_01085 [Candidatus Micrarchaeota archaeon CG_4_10_14_0_2_um_filter_55_9]PJD01576.1 MAG: hypothetical protein COU38_00265 [Candidatus Micrarchaeota archaeon CG10_big_fil_rev_8_21_14_0_10_54_18]